MLPENFVLTTATNIQLYSTRTKEATVHLNYRAGGKECVASVMMIPWRTAFHLVHHELLATTTTNTFAMLTILHMAQCDRKWLRTTLFVGWYHDDDDDDRGNRQFSEQQWK